MAPEVQTDTTRRLIRRIDWLSIGVVGLMIAALEAPWWSRSVGITVTFLIPVIFGACVIWYAKRLGPQSGHKQ